jgi:hypothetical protein
MSDMIQVKHPNKLSGEFIAHFIGKSYADSILLAEQFAKRTGAILRSYFEQEHGHKTILVGYSRKESSHE